MLSADVFSAQYFIVKSSKLQKTRKNSTVNIHVPSPDSLVSILPHLLFPLGASMPDCCARCVFSCMYLCLWVFFSSKLF